MSTRMATLIIFAGGILGGCAGWKMTSLLMEDFFGVIHVAALILGTWSGLLVSFLVAILIGRWRQRKQRRCRRTGMR